MTRRQFKFFILLNFLLSISIYSQTINKIEISGANFLSENEYRNIISLQNTRIFDGISDTIKSRIISASSNYGLFNMNVDSLLIHYSEDSLSVKIDIFLNENSPTEVNKIIMQNCDSVYIDDINSITELLEDNVYNRYELENSFEDILKYFEERGFPFAKIKVASIYFFTKDEKYLADIYLSIEKGKPATIDELKIDGNDKTKDYVIARALRIKPGEEYSQSKLNEIPARLNRLRFFEPVETPVFYFNTEDKGILNIKVKEKETNSFDGIIGYVPSSNDNEKGFFTGYVNISLRNLFGTGRAAAVRWQQEDRNSQELELKYLEPWLFDYPFNISAGLFQRKQDTTYVQRNFNGAIEYLATEDISASFLFESESTIPTDNGNNIFTVFNSTAISTGANLIIDTRDDAYSPTEGFLFKNTYLFKAKSINGPKEYLTPDLDTKINQQRLELDFSYFYNLFTRQVISAAVHARELRGGFFEISDLYKLGGAKTLRGYREKQFIGNRLFWSNLEYRYLLSSRSYVFLFFDTGYYLRNEDAARKIDRTSAFKLGYGLGINLETALGVMGVSFALGEGDSFGDGKIHFGLINDF